MPLPLYVDCFSGASGDMLLGALVDAGVDTARLRELLETLPASGWSLAFGPAEQHGLRGSRANVRLVDAKPGQPHRGLSDVLAIVDGGQLPDAVRLRARVVFERLAEVEAFIHGTSVEEIEFHEVGAIDSIVDVVGVVAGLHLLDVDWSRLYCSGLPLGSGWVRAAHGRLPVPAPATLELIKRGGALLRPAPSAEETGELTTPTAAALLTTLAQFRAQPPFERVERIGYGFGTREPAWPNAVRVLLGGHSAIAPGTSEQLGLVRETIVEVQTNLDDATPEELGFAMERLLEAGALDVAFSPLQMKKNRPGVLVRVLGRQADGERLAALVLEHTSALGARVQSIERLIARRVERRVTTPWGEVRVKVKLLGAREVVAPEYEDCARVACAANVPLRLVYDAARTAGVNGAPSDFRRGE